MPFTIYLRQISKEQDVFAYEALEFDGFLWMISAPGLEFAVWDPDSLIFCSASRALLRMLSKGVGNVREEGSVPGAPKFGKLFLPDTPRETVVKALSFYRNPVELIATKDST